MPKVTIIIPNYNHARFLQRRISSVLSQTYQDFEVLYLDDGSTDDSPQVFAAFSDDSRIKSVPNKTNSGGTFKQWNKGVRLAQGEYIWIAESDDYADRQFLSRLVDVLDKNPNVGLAYCHSMLVDDQGNVHSWSIGERGIRDFLNKGKDECRTYLLFTNTIPCASAVVFRRDVYEKAGYADESMLFCGDWLMWIAMLLISDIAFVSDPLNYYRRHSGSVSSKMGQSLASVQERYCVARHIKRNLQLNKISLEQACESLMDMWFELLFSPTGKKEWRRNASVYKAARDVDSKVELRLIKRFIVLCLTTLGIIAPIRAIKRFIKRLLLPAGIA